MRTLKKHFVALNQSNAATLGGGTAIVAIVRFASTSILTRLLAPEAFAVTVILTSIITTFELISDIGLRPFVVRDPQGTEEKAGDVIWTLQVIRGVCLAALMFILAPNLAQAFGNPEAVNYIRTAALIPLVAGFRSLGEPLASRAGKQRINERVLVLRTLLTTIITIGMAIWLRNAWALVIGISTTGAVHAVIDWFVYRRHWRLKFHWDKEIFLRVLHFSKFLFLSSLLTLVIGQVDKVVISRNFSLELVGLYGMALTLVITITTMIMSYARNVFFPVIARAFREETLDKDTMRAAMGIAPLAFLYISGGAITGGEIFFQIVFDDRYLYGGVFFSVVAMRGIFLTVSELTSCTETAFGNTRHSFEMNIIRIVWMAITMPLMIDAYGAIGLAAAISSIDAVPAMIGMIRTARRQLFVKRYYAMGVLAVGAGVLTGLIGTWLLKVTAAALSIPL